MFITWVLHILCFQNEKCQFFHFSATKNEAKRFQGDIQNWMPQVVDSQLVPWLVDLRKDKAPGSKDHGDQGGRLFWV